MKLNIFGWETLKNHFPNLSFTKLQLLKTLTKEFSTNYRSSINIVFTSSLHIKKLNKEFRKKDSVTDVLSFVVEESPLLGEIYICPEYIEEKYDENEVIRDIVHGILHLLGEDHKYSFDPEFKENEEMFVKQENILQNILYEINNRTGKPRKKVSTNKA